MLHPSNRCRALRHGALGVMRRLLIGNITLAELFAESGPHVPIQDAFREKPTLTQFAFTRLLEWLDDGADSHGERYLEMRRRLVSYFDRRNRPDADELADDTFNRIARTLEQTGVIATTPPARYCYVVARFVLLENFRRDRRFVPYDDTRDTVSGPRLIGLFEPNEHLAIQAERLDCLDRCLEELRPEQRDLAIEYYRDARRQRIERRRNLATRLGITMNALAIRACRLRDALMTCVEACRSQPRKF
jgi:DNA-directed RNA polymerase specialized sigma24 family protein